MLKTKGLLEKARIDSGRESLARNEGKAREEGEGRGNSNGICVHTRIYHVGKNVSIPK
jgi:hypothetical protein